jgi:MATE family multidrug resistance protein
MRNAMIASLLAFMLAWWVLTPLGNHGLWLAFYVYFVARALSLYVYLPQLKARTGSAGSHTGHPHPRQ